jgi:hypothetical protein
LIEEEEFKSDNFNTPRSLDKTSNMIIHNVSTPYGDNIIPILSTIIKNPLEEDVELPDGEMLKKHESISWLKLIRLSKGVEISKMVDPDQGSNEISILDKHNNMIGEIKDIKTLKNMYLLSIDELVRLEEGETTDRPRLGSAGRHLYFKKLINFK